MTETYKITFYRDALNRAVAKGTITKESFLIMMGNAFDSAQVSERPIFQSTEITDLNLFSNTPSNDGAV